MLPLLTSVAENPGRSWDCMSALFLVLRVPMKDAMRSRMAWSSIVDALQR